MGDRVDQEVAMSQGDKEIETEAAWQAHYIQWGLMMGILDPCGHRKGYQRIIAIYVGPQIGMNPIALWGLPDLEY